jgi:hypothetical protein
MVMSSYVMKKLTGWTPELNPTRDSPLYQWRWLARNFEERRNHIGSLALAE